MKRPECMEKPLDWSGVPVTHICPKCGSEMEANYPIDATHYRYDCPNFYCGHWQVIKDIREEKVGGEKL